MCHGLGIFPAFTKGTMIKFTHALPSLLRSAFLRNRIMSDKALFKTMSLIVFLVLTIAVAYELTLKGVM